jgi:3-methyl-2-oxobutanoate hydroxymethyltransferase
LSHQPEPRGHGTQDGARTKVTTETLRAMKQDGKRISALTAYDHPFASLVDAAGVDVVLVGDSVGTVVQGRDTTVGVTMDEMVYHCRLVRRGVERALVVGDMPFLSYHVSADEALRNAGRLLQQGEAEAVKVEGGGDVVEVVRRLGEAGIAVFGHLGLTPQSIHRFGTYRVRGRTPDEAARIREDALRLQDAGATAIVLEKVPSALAREITASLEIPTIGIGAGPDCDGQILVTHDMLGLFTRFRPRFVRRYLDLADQIESALGRYVDDVREGRFPDDSESYGG